MPLSNNMTAARMDPTEKTCSIRQRSAAARGSKPRSVFVFATGRRAVSQTARGFGHAYYSLGQYDDAVATSHRDWTLGYEGARFSGKMYRCFPQFADEVTKRLAHLVQIYPDNAVANYYYALSLRKRALSGTNESQGGTEFTLRAVKLDPSYADARFELGLFYEDEKQDAKAIQEYELAIKLRPDLSKAHYHLGRLYQKNGQPARAQKELDAFEALKTKQ